MLASRPLIFVVWFPILRGIIWGSYAYSRVWLKFRSSTRVFFRDHKIFVAMISDGVVAAGFSRLIQRIRRETEG